MTIKSTSALARTLHELFSKGSSGAITVAKGSKQEDVCVELARHGIVKIDKWNEFAIAVTRVCD